MPLPFVDVHRPAEDEDRVVVEGIGGRLRPLGRRPLVELATGLGDRLGEDAGPGVALVDYREDSHCHPVSQ